jgi:hypothetical protein
LFEAEVKWAEVMSGLTRLALATAVSTDSAAAAPNSLFK